MSESAALDDDGVASCVVEGESGEKSGASVNTNTAAGVSRSQRRGVVVGWSVQAGAMEACSSQIGEGTL